VAIEVKPHVIQSVSFEAARDPRNGALVYFRARQTAFVDGLTAGDGAKAVEQAKAAVENAYTPDQLGLPDLTGQTALIVQHVDARLSSCGTKAMVYVTWGSPAYIPFSGGQPPTTAWSVNFTHRTKRYFQEGTVQFASDGQTIAGSDLGPNFSYVDVPAAIIYRLEHSDTLPSNVMAGVGGFVQIAGVFDKVRVMPPDVQERGAGGNFRYEIKRAWEWRKPLVATNKGNVRGWTEFAIAENGSAIEVTPMEAP
jgi:hypothetical protein